MSATLHLLLIAIHHIRGILHPVPDPNCQLRRTRIACVFAWLGPFFTLLALSLAFPGQGFWSQHCQRVDFYHSRLFRICVSLLLVSIFLVITSCYVRLVCLSVELMILSFQLLILRANRQRFIKNDSLCAKRRVSLKPFKEKHFLLEEDQLRGTDEN